MNVRLLDFLRLYKFPSGRASYALARTVEAASQHDAPQVARLAESALQHARALDALQVRRRRASETPQYGPDAARLDGDLDRLLSALAAHITSLRELLSALPASDPKAEALTLLERELFPRGVVAVTSLSFVEEQARVASLLERITAAGDLAGAMDALDLTPYATRLSELNDAFGAALNVPAQRSGPTADELRAQDAKLQLALQQVVAAALGRFVAEDDTTIASRAAVLGPILTQQARLAALYRARRGVRDVNPDTGEEQDPSVDADPVAA